MSIEKTIPEIVEKLNKILGSNYYRKGVYLYGYKNYSSYYRNTSCNKR